MDNPIRQEEQLFEAARALPLSERQAFLDAACAGQPSLRRQVNELLEGFSKADQFFALGTAALDRSSIALGTLEQPGDHIGRYRLIEPLGEGGCAVVYLAAQEKPVHRSVALKIIKLGMDTRSVVARFEAERQALALMDHQSIAKVFDAGTTDSGRPFFVMELVRGIRITDYCVRNHLSIRQCLKLFVQVCLAVQHAHQKGIIHRDLKPSNILVTAQNGQPLPKVIDFGIARATQERLTDRTLVTTFAQLLGTPAYMSPEQANLASDDIDTRSDVYSLGVLLYELLAGNTPFETKELLMGGLDQMRQAIRERDPVPPSRRVAHRVHLNLFSESKFQKWKFKIPADLDCIVMKCLEKDRARRYETADALAMDIQRHLRNEPILARAPSRLYRFQKFARRNKVLLGAGTLVLLSLMFGVTAAAWQAAQAMKARRIAQQARNSEEELRHKVEAEFYSADMKVVWDLWMEGDLKQAEDTLQAHFPKPGEVDRRDFAWRYLWNLCRDERLRTVARGPNEPLNRLQGSPNHRFLAACGEKGLTLLDPVTGADGPLPWSRTAERGNPVVRVALAAQATNLLAVARSHGEVELWDCARRLLLWTWQPLAKPADGLALSDAGDSLAIGERSGSRGHVFLWRRSTLPNSVLSLVWSNVTENSTWALRFSPDGRVLVGNGKSSLRGSIFAWDAMSGHELAGFPKASVGDLFDLAFSPDGRLLASSGAQSDINVWDFASRTVAFTLQGHQGHVNSLAFSPDGRRLISGGDDGTIRFWDTAQGHFLGMARDTNGAIRSVVWGPGAGVIISTTGNDVTFRKPEPPVPATVIETGQELGRTAVSGHWLVTTRATSWSEDYAEEESADVWDLASHKFRFHLIHHNGQPTAPVFSPDGRLFAFGGEGANRVIGIWETKRWNDARAPLEPDHWWTNDFEVGSLAFSPDSKVMAAAGISYTPEHPSGTTNRLTFFEVGSWRKLYLLEKAGAGLAENAASVAFSNDGRLLAVGYRDGRTCLWDFKRQRLLWNRRVPGRFAGYGVGVTFSADHRWLASFSVGGTGVVLYDLSSPEQPPRELPKAEHSSLWCALFDPESRSLVTSGNDGQIRFWNLETLQVELTLQHSHGGPHVCFCFAPNGNLLASMDAHGTVKLWEAAPRTVWVGR